MFQTKTKNKYTRYINTNLIIQNKSKELSSSHDVHQELRVNTYKFTENKIDEKETKEIKLQE